MVRRRRVLIAVLACWTVVSLPGTSPRAESPEEIFERGNAAYDAGRFDEAAEAYRMLLRYQFADPRIEYNLGNAEFKRGELGRAILHYERARRLSPTDPDIRANLEYARSLRMDRVPETPRFAIAQWVVDLQDRLGPDRQAWIVVGVVWIMGGLLAWGLAVPGRWRAGHGWTLAVLVLLLALSASSWLTTHRRLVGTTVAVVLVPSVEVLSGPGSNNATLATIHEGLEVEVWGERSEWIQVRLPNAVSGWLPRTAVEVI